MPGIRMKTTGYPKVKNRWKQYGEIYSGQNPVLFNKAAEIISKEGVSDNFEKKGQPQKWPKRKYKYDWPILWKTGRMRARLERTALTWEHRGRKHRNKIYGPMYTKYHHYADTEAPKRLPVRKTVQFTEKTLAKLRTLQEKVFLRK